MNSKIANFLTGGLTGAFIVAAAGFLGGPATAVAASLILTIGGVAVAGGFKIRLQNATEDEIDKFSSWEQFFYGVAAGGLAAGFANVPYVEPNLA